jgi:DNA-binding transcriptional ArsR family regulator
MEGDVCTTKQKKLARYAKALGHPVRVYIMEFLSKEKSCFSGELSDILPIAKSTLSQHIKELRNAELIKGETEAPKIRYCVNTANWEEAKMLFKEFMK